MSTQNIKDAVYKITKPLSLKEVNDVFYKIILEKKIEQAEEDIKNGRVYTNEQAKEKLKRWLS
jgi:hypothetical protein